MAGRDAALGSRIALDRQLFQIIGVTPPSFHGVDIGHDFDVAVALCSEPVFDGKDSWTDNPMTWWLSLIGRLKPGWTLERASAQLAAISPGIFAATLPPKYDDTDKKNYLRFHLGAVQADNGVSSLRGKHDPLNVLLGLSGWSCCWHAPTWRICCWRGRAPASARWPCDSRWERRARLMRQVLAESLLLAIFGTAVGFGLAQVLSRLLVAMLSSESNSIFLDMAPDWRVLGFALGLAVLTCILFGLTPALQASHTDPGAAMKANGRGATSGRERFLLRRVLIVTQVALSLILLTGALLFARSLHNLMTLDAGFDQDHLLVASFDYSPLQIPVERRTAFQHEIYERMRAIPGVISYMVVRRRSEIGIRMALGAARGAILRMVLRESVVLLAIGVAIGAGIALAAGSVAAYMLYGLKPRDPATFAISVLALTVIVLLASLLPAGRAANVDPMIVLREE